MSVEHIHYSDNIQPELNTSPLIPKTPLKAPETDVQTNTYTATNDQQKIITQESHLDSFNPFQALPINYDFLILLSKVLLNPILKDFLASNDLRFLDPKEKAILDSIKNDDISTIKTLIDSGLKLSSIIGGKTILEHLSEENKLHLIDLFQQKPTALGEKNTKNEIPVTEKEIPLAEIANTMESPELFSFMDNLSASTENTLDLQVDQNIDELLDISKFFNEICETHEKLIVDTRASSQAMIEGPDINAYETAIKELQALNPIDMQVSEIFSDLQNLTVSLRQNNLDPLKDYLGNLDPSLQTLELFAAYLDYIFKNEAHLIKKHLYILLENRKKLKIKNRKESLQSFLIHLFVGFDEALELQRQSSAS